MFGLVDFIALYSVESPMLGPVVARRGEILVIDPRHPTANLIVCGNRPGYPVLRTGFLPLGTLYGAALMMEADGIIRSLGVNWSIRGLNSSLDSA